MTRSTILARLTQGAATVFIVTAEVLLFYFASLHATLA
jgi:hypothetical protein